MPGAGARSPPARVRRGHAASNPVQPSRGASRVARSNNEAGLRANLVVDPDATALPRIPSHPHLLFASRNGRMVRAGDHGLHRLGEQPRGSAGLGTGRAGGGGRHTERTGTEHS